jgi:hypothetical protein
MSDGAEDATNASAIPVVAPVVVAATAVPARTDAVVSRAND